MGATIHEKQQMRIQEGHFLKIALNLDLTLPDDGECRTFFNLHEINLVCVENCLAVFFQFSTCTTSRSFFFSFRLVFYKFSADGPELENR